MNGSSLHVAVPLSASTLISRRVLTLAGSDNGGTGMAGQGTSKNTRTELSDRVNLPLMRRMEENDTWVSIYARDVDAESGFTRAGLHTGGKCVGKKLSKVLSKTTSSSSLTLMAYQVQAAVDE